ncbi:MAG TPA: lipocalin family protein [Ohtaekwangia sp.]
MRKIIYSVLILVSLGSYAQAQSSKDIKIKLIEKIVGSWSLKEVYDSQSKTSRPGATQSTGFSALEFSPDGEFKSFSKGVTIDSGSYRLNENQGKLYLESTETKNDPSEWAISFKNDQMVLKGQGVKHAERYHYIFIRTKEGLSTQQE